MKLLITFLSFLFLNILNAQQQVTGSVSIFSEDGDKFTLILNGEIINDTPQSNLRVEDLNQPYYNAKIKFENQTLTDISTNNLSVTDYNNVFNDVTYKIKRDRNNKSKTKMNFFSSVPVNRGFIPASNVRVIHYGQPQDVIVVRDNAPVRGGTTTTTTTTQTGNGTNVGVGINIGGLNMGVSINDNLGGGTITQTTTTSSTSTSHSNHDGHNHQVQTDYQNESNIGCGRKSCMTQSNFNAAIATIKKITFEETALKTAKQVINVNCLNVDQIIQIANIFIFEENKLDFAKYAYNYCVDQKNYFKINSIFTFDSNAEELSEFIQTKQ